MSTEEGQNKRLLEGRRYLVIARQSSTRKGTTSVEQQVKRLREAGDAAGGTCAGVLELRNTSSTMPGRRKDFKELIQRRVERADFDTLLVLVADRWTRSGPKHGFGMEWKFIEVGVRLYFVDERGVREDNNMTTAFRSFEYIAANDWADKHSMRVCEALSESLTSGRRTTRHTIPFGCDKRVESPDGKAKYIIRDLRDGRWQRLNPDTRELIEQFGPDDPRPLKGKQDRARFVPGPRREQEVVRYIHKLRYLNGMGPRQIARRLNEHGITAWAGRTWTEWRVRYILENSTYCGVTYGLTRTRATFWGQRSSGNGLLKRNPTQEDMAQLSWLKMEWRPPKDWYMQVHEGLRHFLPEEVRTPALRDHEQRLRARYESSLKPKPAHTGGGSRHRGSNFVLSGLLKSEEGYTLTGASGGVANNLRRYYRCKESVQETKTRARLRKQIAAEPLEAALYDALREALLKTPDLEETLAAMLAEELSMRESNASQLQEVRRRHEEVLARTERTADRLGDEGNEFVEETKASLRKLKVERMAIEDEIIRLERQTGTAFEPATVARQMVEQLRDLTKAWPKMPPAQLKEAAAALVGRATVSLDTRQARFDIVLPPWEVPEEPKDSEDEDGDRAQKSRAKTEDQGRPMRRPARLRLVAGSHIRPSHEYNSKVIARVLCRYRNTRAAGATYRCRCARRPRPAAPARRRSV